MEISTTMLRLAVLLMPGLLAAVIVERLTVHPKWEQFRFGVYSLILGCATYVALQIVQIVLQLVVAAVQHSEFKPKPLAVWQSMVDQAADPNVFEIFAACMLAVFIGYFLTMAVEKKWLHRIAHKIGASDKYGDENLFTGFLNTRQTTWLWVRDVQRGVIYEGLKSALSEADHVCELVMTNVRVYHADTQDLLYEIPAIYLSYAPGTIQIEMARLEEVDDARDKKSHSD